MIGTIYANNTTEDSIITLGDVSIGGNITSNTAIFQDLSVSTLLLNGELYTSMTGATGFTGAIGPVGIVGETGATGFTGAVGLAGSDGIAGETGATGFTGAVGLAGSDGIAGETGFTGFTGFTGAAGLAGSDGIAGETGATGFTGAAFDSLIVDNIYGNVSLLQTKTNTLTNTNDIVSINGELIINGNVNIIEYLTVSGEFVANTGLINKSLVGSVSPPAYWCDNNAMVGVINYPMWGSVSEIILFSGPNNSDDCFFVSPNFKLVVYQDANYGGLSMTFDNFNGSKLMKCILSGSNQMSSYKIFHRTRGEILETTNISTFTDCSYGITYTN